MDVMCGGVLLSREASLAVPSALRGLTSGFGMGPGVSPSLWPPQLYGDISRAWWFPAVFREPHSGREPPGRPGDTWSVCSVCQALGLLVPVS